MKVGMQLAKIIPHINLVYFVGICKLNLDPLQT